MTLSTRTCLLKVDYTIRRATIIGGKPVAHERKFLTGLLSDQPSEDSSDLYKLTGLLDALEEEYQAKAKKLV